MTRTVSNAKPYPVDLPKGVLAPGGSADVETDPTIDALVEAGVLVDQADEEPTTPRRGSKSKDVQ